VNFVYQEAVTHTRFHHAIWSDAFDGKSLKVFPEKNMKYKESSSCSELLLLHAIGHGPLLIRWRETFVTQEFIHESISYLFIEALTKRIHGALDLA